MCRILSSSSLEAIDVMKELKRPHTKSNGKRHNLHKAHSFHKIIHNTISEAVSIAPKSYPSNDK